MFIYRAHRCRQLDNDQRRHYTEPGFRKEIIIHSGVERNTSFNRKKPRPKACQKKKEHTKSLKQLPVGKSFRKRKQKLRQAFSVLNKMKVSASFFSLQSARPVNVTSIQLCIYRSI